MGQLVYVLGRSGTGKSYSLRYFKPEEVAIVNVESKILPFRTAFEYKCFNTDEASRVAELLTALGTEYKRIVIDDFQYLMSNEFMRRAKEKGYDKFTEIAEHAWSVADTVKKLPTDVIVYVLCHTDTDNDGFERLKTIGKLLDEKIVLEGMSTIVLKTNVSDGEYTFITQNNGKDTTKTPEGMFDSYAIRNNLKYVDDKIRSYYHLGEEFKEDMSDEDAEAEVKKEAPERKRKRKSVESEESKPTRRTRKREVVHKPTPDEIPEGEFIDADEVEDIPFKSEEEQTEEPTDKPAQPKRKKRSAE